jgi:hypothetical protein
LLVESFNLIHSLKTLVYLVARGEGRMFSTNTLQIQVDLVVSGDHFLRGLLFFVWSKIYEVSHHPIHYMESYMFTFVEAGKPGGN